jgi:hypothetical protein
MDANHDLSTFKADEEKHNQLSNKIPQCIKDLPSPDNQRESLTIEQTQLAMQELNMKEFLKLDFPKKTKFRVDPTIPGQTYGLVSFIPAKNARPDQEGCFGVLKLRGNFPSVGEADRWSENILRNYDSYSEIDFVYVGRDFPIMVDNTQYCSTTREVDIRKKIDETVKESIKKKKEEEKKELEEIQERQQKLLNKNKEENKEETYEDLDYYTQLRVKKANAQMMIEQCHARLQECNNAISETDNEIGELDVKYPEYKEEFLAKYKHALAAIGTDAAQNPLIKYMEDSSTSSSSTSSSSTSSSSLQTISEESRQEEKETV